jgi:S1-C subfamily serine protease
MKTVIRSQFVSAVLGGLVVALLFLALGITGHRRTQAILEEAPAGAQPASGSATLTPHAIYIRDAPGVVYVEAQVDPQPGKSPFDLFSRPRTSHSSGSGFLVDREGHILTNYHVIAGADRQRGVTVRFEDDVSRRAQVVDEDPDDDLALLKVDMTNLPAIRALPLGDSATVRVGDPTLAIGNPFGLDRTLTSGIVSAMQRQVQAPNGFTIDNVIQTDAPLNPGNAGGPLLDAAGRVIGINSQMVTAGSASALGIAFAVPINTAKDLLPALAQNGRTR